VDDDELDDLEKRIQAMQSDTAERRIDTREWKG